MHSTKMDKVAKNTQWIRIIFPINVLGKLNKYMQEKEKKKKLVPHLISLTKFISKCTKNLRPDTVKLLEENI